MKPNVKNSTERFAAKDVMVLRHCAKTINNLHFIYPVLLSLKTIKRSIWHLSGFLEHFIGRVRGNRTRKPFHGYSEAFQAKR